MMNDELPREDFDHALYGQKCIECRWYFPDRKQKNPKCQKRGKCEFESRKEHADKLLTQFNEIFDHPCGNCLNSLFCYQGGPNETKCSKVKSKEEKERYIQYWKDKNADEIKNRQEILV